MIYKKKKKLPKSLPQRKIPENASVYSPLCIGFYERYLTFQLVYNRILVSFEVQNYFSKYANGGFGENENDIRDPVSSSVCVVE